MKKISCLSMFLFCAFWLAAASASINQKQVDQKPAYLFVLSAKNGWVKKAGKNTYLLAMRLSAKGQVTMFSDRPYRIVKLISVKEFLSIGRQQRDSFLKDPANAALSSINIRPTIIKVIHVYSKKNWLYYKFQLVKPGATISVGTLSKIVITIDSSSATCNSAASSQCSACESTYKSCYQNVVNSGATVDMQELALYGCSYHREDCSDSNNCCTGFGG